jgi:uncharacterized Zn finger protein (UPF0148 family)
VAKTFNCPRCGGPLDYKETGELTLRCPFCSNSVIVPEELRIPKPAETSPAAAPDPAAPLATPSDAVLERLKNLASTATDARELRHIARTERRIVRRQERDEAHKQRRRDIGK